ncbi:phasin family protein [Aquibium carbonis]|nr:phasin family protein [Aquibium carbonis]
MTKTTATHANTDVFAQFAKGFEDLQARFGFQANGRDTALKGIATTREHVATARNAFAQTTGQAGKIAGEAGQAFASAARDMAEAGFANADMALDAFEKMLTAETPADAFKAQSDYVQTAVTANVERIRKTAETASETVAARVEQVRGEFEKLTPRKAA